jgi:MOSC domain-containing protein YiiM
MATTKGRIRAISVSIDKGTPKTNVPEALLVADHGLSGDAHAGPHHRQVSLLALESIDKMIQKGANVAPGDFAENITTEGIDLQSLALGAKLRLGRQAVLEITQHGKACHGRCAVYDLIGDCIMPREGLFARVRTGGVIHVADPIEVCDVQGGSVDH